ncbi:HECT-domain-containing protein [Pestalotiopsis sp. NC0098]|nr:HECT-domain-containing protein [Pestalotiopsis sp. NC0098]
MFQSFTGNSKRPRNVNLSGQRTNPWATSGWNAPPSGASQTIANAQAEREKRQKDREILIASRRIQRVWRGRAVRKDVQCRCRKDWDDLYVQDIQVLDRIPRALSLLPAFFDAKDDGDRERLECLINDLTSVRDLDLEERQRRKLASTIVSALEQQPTSPSIRLFSLLIDMIKRRPTCIDRISDAYYMLIARCCQQSGYGGQVEPIAVGQDLLAEAIAAPLSRPDEGSYEAFAFSFLTSQNLRFLQANPETVAKFLDAGMLSQAIVTGLVQHHRANQVSRDGLLWLLAYFVALCRATPPSRSSAYLEALYRLLTELSADIRIRNRSQQTTIGSSDNESDDSDGETIGPLAPYVVQQLESLVSEDGIAELLQRFTSTATSNEQASEEASLLAGYTLILLRCFPKHGDDIKIRLFHGDIITPGRANLATVPSVKFLWQAVSRTSIFSAIAHKEAEQKSRIVVSLLQSDPVRDPEWRTLLLFLELYNFLLRVTDDEDFLPAETEVLADPSPAVMRIRASGLRLLELKDLVTFLKNLSFPLYYNLPEIMPSSALSAAPTVSALFGSSTSGQQQMNERITTTFAGIQGMDVLTLRAAATGTMRALYERDSRRPFLRRDFWLMTSRFDMDGFLAAVVLEEQKKWDIEEDDEETDELEAPGSFHTSSGHRLTRAAQIERQRQHKRAQREKLLAQVGPKLEILRNMPFTIPFEVRVQIFRQFIHLDKAKRRNGAVDADSWRAMVMHGGLGQTRAGRDSLGRHSATIKRGQLFSDAYDQFYSLGESLKEPIQITFVDKFDQPEAGIDGGGVTKEFLTSVTSEAFTPKENLGMFVTNSQNLLYPNPTIFDELVESLRYYGIPENSAEWNSRLQELAQKFEFLGRVVGKCMYEGILIDLSFAPFFLLKWSSSDRDFRASLNELRDLDPELYRGLIQLKNYPGDVSDLALDFTINDRVTNPMTNKVRTMTRPLRKGGENAPVTNKDRPLYISYVVRHRLVAQPYRQTKAFLRGLSSIIDPTWLSMFNQSELQRLVGGDSSEIDVEDLRRNTIYSGLYVIGDDGEEHPTIKMFWQVMRELEDPERREVLKYVTSTPRAPLLGFEQLSPAFSIRDGGTDENRLPSTSTCVNLLKLPRYKSAATLKEKLLYAVKSGAGFDLS